MQIFRPLKAARAILSKIRRAGTESGVAVQQRLASRRFDSFAWGHAQTSTQPRLSFRRSIASTADESARRIRLQKRARMQNHPSPSECPLLDTVLQEVVAGNGSAYKIASEFNRLLMADPGFLLTRATATRWMTAMTELPDGSAQQAEELWRFYVSQRDGQQDAHDASRTERFLLVARLKAQAKCNDGTLARGTAIWESIGASALGPNQQAYEMLLLLHSKHGGVDTLKQLWSIVDEMRSSGFHMTTNTCNKLLRALGTCEGGTVRQGAELVEQLLLTQRLKQSSLVLLLRLHVTCPDGSAVRAHEQMRRAIAKHRRWQFQDGLLRNYFAALVACEDGSAKLAQEGVELVRKHSADRLKPLCPEALCVLIGAQRRLKDGSAAKANAYLEEVALPYERGPSGYSNERGPSGYSNERGPSGYSWRKPNAATVIKAVEQSIKAQVDCRDGSAAQAESYIEWLHNILDSPLPARTLQLLVNAHHRCSDGSHAQAQLWAARVRTAGRSHPRTATDEANDQLRSLIRGHSKGGARGRNNAEQAETIYRAMTANGIAPTLETLHLRLAVQASSSDGSAHEAEKIYEGMLRDHAGLQPNEATLSRRLSAQAYCPDGSAPAATAIMAEAMAEGRGLKPSIAHYNLSILANAFCPDGSVAGALAAFQDMQVPPNTGTYHNLLATFVRHGSVMDAMDFYMGLLRRGVSPTTQSCNTLIKAHCESAEGSAATVMKIVHDMQALSLSADATTFQHAIYAQYKCTDGSLYHLQQLIHDLKAAPCPPSRHTLRSSLVALRRFAKDDSQSDAAMAAQTDKAIWLFGAEGYRLVEWHISNGVWPEKQDWHRLMQLYSLDGDVKSVADVFYANIWTPRADDIANFVDLLSNHPGDRLAIHHSQLAVELATKLKVMNSKMRRSVKRSSCLQSPGGK